MKDPFENIAALDKIVHEPSRLAILTALSACASADFLFLQRLIGLTKGNLSAHLTKLEQAQLIEIEKVFEGKIPKTRISISKKGKTALTHYWLQLEQIKKNVQDWKLALGTPSLKENIS
jgi:DNA-binding transcriptional ArsR family regulator